MVSIGLEVTATVKGESSEAQVQISPSIEVQAFSKCEITLDEYRCQSENQEESVTTTVNILPAHTDVKCSFLLIKADKYGSPTGKISYSISSCDIELNHPHLYIGNSADRVLRDYNSSNGEGQLQPLKFKNKSEEKVNLEILVGWDPVI